MHPIVTVVHIFGVAVPIGSYGLLLAAAFVTSMLWMGRSATQQRLDVGATLACVACATAGAMAGGYALFVLVEALRSGDVAHAARRGGVVYFGGAIGGVAALWLGCHALKLPWRTIADLAVPPLAVSHTLGRIGCFLGGCCYGEAWNGAWSVTYTHALAPAAYPSVPRHPVPLYEAGMLWALAVGFTIAQVRRPPGGGNHLYAYFLLYALGRIVLEIWRGDAVRGFVGADVSTSQLLGAAIATLCASLLLRDRQAGSRAASWSS